MLQELWWMDERLQSAVVVVDFARNTDDGAPSRRRLHLIVCSWSGFQIIVCVQPMPLNTCAIEFECNCYGKRLEVVTNWYKLHAVQRAQSPDRRRIGTPAWLLHWRTNPLQMSPGVICACTHPEPVISGHWHCMPVVQQAAQWSGSPCVTVVGSKQRKQQVVIAVTIGYTQHWHTISAHVGLGASQVHGVDLQPCYLFQRIQLQVSVSSFRRLVSLPLH